MAKSHWQTSFLTPFILCVIKFEVISLKPTENMNGLLARYMIAVTFYVISTTNSLKSKTALIHAHAAATKQYT